MIEFINAINQINWPAATVLVAAAASLAYIFKNF